MVSIFLLSCGKKSLEKQWLMTIWFYKCYALKRFNDSTKENHHLNYIDTHLSGKRVVNISFLFVMSLIHQRVLSKLTRREENETGHDLRIYTVLYRRIKYNMGCLGSHKEKFSFRQHILFLKLSREWLGVMEGQVRTCGYFLKQEFKLLRGHWATIFISCSFLICNLMTHFYSM